MQTANFDESLESILAKDPRYPREAYLFLREALDHTTKHVVRQGREGARKENRHVSGQELLEGIRLFALEQFGPMTLTVLHEWGIRRCEDFGEIVFNMVEANLLGKTEKDSRDDFKGGYDFEEAFRDPFLPRRAKPSPTGAGQAQA
ncbi:MAG: hypothetical protein RJA22_1241 [Verrucomicrobiota bacterium]|jgi:uncharacterized repeat protein (TIGR04138 family)